MDPRTILQRIPTPERDKPFRFLDRRLIHALAEASTVNPLARERTAPGAFIVLRIVGGDAEAEEWESQFRESAARLRNELTREAQARGIRLRSAADVELRLVRQGELSSPHVEAALAGNDVARTAALRTQLAQEHELILPRHPRVLTIESQPTGAQAYVNNKPVGVTPCRVEDLSPGDHRVTLHRPGCVPYECVQNIAANSPLQLRLEALLESEPEMGLLDLRSCPPGAKVTVGSETRVTPVRWRLPSGAVEARFELQDYAPETVTLTVRPEGAGPTETPLIRLRYDGPDRDEVVGRLVIYEPGSPMPAVNVTAQFFREIDGGETLSEWELPGVAEPRVLGEKSLRRGVVLIGREDARSPLRPDVRLFDPENSVSRGCHAWLWVYADTSTGAAYNTFLIGNNSPAGIRVDGDLVMETRRLSDDSVIELGNFRLRVLKSVPTTRVEFDP